MHFGRHFCPDRCAASDVFVQHLCPLTLQQVHDKLPCVSHCGNVFYAAKRSNIFINGAHKEQLLWRAHTHTSCVTLRLSGIWTDVGRLSVPRSPPDLNVHFLLRKLTPRENNRSLYPLNTHMQGSACKPQTHTLTKQSVCVVFRWGESESWPALTPFSRHSSAPNLIKSFPFLEFYSLRAASCFNTQIQLGECFEINWYVAIRSGWAVALNGCEMSSK